MQQNPFSRDLSGHGKPAAKQVAPHAVLDQFPSVLFWVECVGAKCTPIDADSEVRVESVAFCGDSFRFIFAVVIPEGVG